MYKIIALIGESGSGKDSIMKEVLKQHQLTLHSIVNCSTRPQREGDIDGVTYHFLSPEEFAYKVLQNEMIEATSFNDWFYGTSYEDLRSDIFNIGVFNPDSIRAMENRPDISLTVFRVICDDKIRLLRQLNREEHPNVDEIVRRYKADKEDFNDLEFKHIDLRNENLMDLIKATKMISDCISHEDKNG